MKKQVRKKLLTRLIILLVVVSVALLILYIQTKVPKDELKYCKKDSDCKIQQGCGCFVALNKNVSIDVHCKEKITKLFENNESEIEDDDSCPWKLETTIVKCIKHKCTLVEIGK